jgi:hypothetical protein
MLGDSVCRWPTVDERVRLARHGVPIGARAAVAQQDKAVRGNTGRGGTGRKVLTNSLREADLLEPVVLGKVPGELSPRPQAAFAQHRAEVVLDRSGADK